MIRSPTEEEGKDASTGSASWPRSRRYAVGDEVEVNSSFAVVAPRCGRSWQPPMYGQDRRCRRRGTSWSCTILSRRTTVTDGGRASSLTSSPRGGGTRRHGLSCRSCCSARYWSSRPYSCGLDTSSCTEAGWTRRKWCLIPKNCTSRFSKLKFLKVY